MAKKRNKDKEASPGRSSKIARVSEKKKDVGKAREIEEIVVPVLAANTAKSARGMSTRGDGSAEALPSPFLQRPFPSFPAMIIPHSAARYVSPPAHSRVVHKDTAFRSAGNVFPKRRMNTTGNSDQGVSSPERDILFFAKKLAGPQPMMHSPAYSFRGSSYAPPSGHVRVTESGNARDITQLQNSVILLRTEIESNATRPVPRIARPDGSGNKGVHYDANLNLPVVSAAQTAPVFVNRPGSVDGRINMYARRNLPTVSTAQTVAFNAGPGTVDRGHYNYASRNLPYVNTTPTASAAPSVPIGMNLAVNPPRAIPAAAAIFVSPRGLEAPSSIVAPPQDLPTFYDGIAVLDNYCKPKEVGKPVPEYWAKLTATAFNRSVSEEDKKEFDKLYLSPANVPFAKAPTMPAYVWSRFRC